MHADDEGEVDPHQQCAGEDAGQGDGVEIVPELHHQRPLLSEDEQRGQDDELSGIVDADVPERKRAEDDRDIGEADDRDDGEVAAQPALLVGQTDRQISRNDGRRWRPRWGR